MNSAQKVVVIVGVGFAALVLAQAVFRSGTPAVFDWEWNKSADKRDLNAATDAQTAIFGEVMGLDWDGVMKVIAQDGSLFEQAVKYGAPEHTPGIVANVGDYTGRPYVIVDDETYYLSGR